VTIGIIELICTALYVIPATSILGAILLTGYLGGAVAAHMRVGNPIFEAYIFPALVGALVWGGVLLSEYRLRALVPVRHSPAT
jgi:DoxX-like family